MSQYAVVSIKSIRLEDSIDQHNVFGSLPYKCCNQGDQSTVDCRDSIDTVREWVLSFSLAPPVLHSPIPDAPGEAQIVAILPIP
jgi:hypothetical protein